MSQENLTILILGITGYVGGSLFTRLVKSYPNARFVGLVRAESMIPAIKAAGCHEVIQGTSTDYEKIRDATSKADVVFNIADCDDVGLTEAILEGTKLRFQATGKRPVLIHTSGTGVIMDWSHGVLDPQVAAAPIDDGVEEDIKTRIKPENIHRPVDSRIFAADAEGYVDASIIAPPLIYGPSSGPLPRESRQIPIIIDMALKTGQAVKIGDGSATWDNIHIDDLLDFYELLLKHVLSTESRAAKISPFAKFYIVVSDKHRWGELTEVLAKALHERGLVPTPEVKSITLEEANKLHSFAIAVCTNSLGISTRAKALGWKPKRLDWRKDAVADLDIHLKNLGKI
ncbi:NAD(P)-binding protein [Auricularia subglabra TFB-10046 SS5]|nr:NAD(P)-binding protein [Auricularia subglabra TFB-10046 SS5]